MHDTCVFKIMLCLGGQRGEDSAQWEGIRIHFCARMAAEGDRIGLIGLLLASLLSARVLAPALLGTYLGHRDYRD